MFRFTAPPPLSLYIHFPWCVRKCPYCDFNSHPLHGELPEGAYIEALLRDLEQDLPRVWGRGVHSVYLGGGTPSLFSPEAITRLLSGVRARLPLRPEAEITLEANPGTVDAQRFAGYREAGVNRLSVGIQSFDADKLERLGRIHGRDEALAAAQAARAAGFGNFNLDLMFGLPEQGPEQALEDLDTALALEPPHLSLYQLTLEPNTLFHARPPLLPDEDELGSMQSRLHERLAGAGYQHYEVSAHARPGHECRHNLNYWLFGDYLGIGAGAHAKLSEATGITRLHKPRHPRDYLQHAGSEQGIAGERCLKPEDAVLEFMMNALRLSRGFPTPLFQERTGLPVACARAALQQAEARGWLEWDVKHIRPTAAGRRFLDDVLTLFVPD